MSVYVLVIHGFESTAPNFAARTLREKTDYNIVAPQLDHKNFDETKKKLHALIDEAFSNPDNEEIIVVGSSMGGFWAHYLVKKFRVKGILVNPALQIEETIKRVDLPYIEAEKYSDLSKEYALNKYKAGSYVDILLGENDKVINPKYALSHFPYCTVLEGEEHRITNEEKIINMVIYAANHLSEC